MGLARNATTATDGKTYQVELDSYKHWSPAWLGKLKDDTRAVNGSLAVLVSTALPEGVHEFASSTASG